MSSSFQPVTMMQTEVVLYRFSWQNIKFELIDKIRKNAHPSVYWLGQFLFLFTYFIYISYLQYNVKLLCFTVARLIINFSSFYERVHIFFILLLYLVILISQMRTFLE